MHVSGFVQSVYGRVRSFLESRSHTPFTLAAVLRKSGATVGRHCYIASTSLSTEPYLVKIGNHVAIEEGVSFMTHDGATWGLRSGIPDLQVFGPIVIEDNCYVGQRVILAPNVRIGPNSIVAPGSVVISDVPPGVVAMGIPARPVGTIEEYRETCLRRWREQRPPQCEPSRSFRSAADRRTALRRHLAALFHRQLAGDFGTPPGLPTDTCQSTEPAGSPAAQHGGR